MIRQALHGYEQGHRLLAATEGLRPVERDLLDRLSDLPGYLPLGYRFARYLTGFPCGDAYALACTWPDPSAPRGGAVYTHTLLLDAAALDAPFGALTALFARPTRGNYSPYTALLVAPDTAVADPAELPPEVIAAFFGSTTRPICRVGVADAEATVAALWRRLWPEARRGLAFCTSAFAPITLPHRPFDLLHLPQESRGAFHRLRPDAGWLEGAVDAPPWLPAMLPPEVIPSWIARCRALDLPLPAPSQVWLLARLDELEAPAKERLAAARTRADQLARVWPDALVARTCWRGALLDLLRAQGQASISARPYWELDDVLARPQTHALRADLPEIEAVVRDEVARRFSFEAPPEEIVERARSLGLETALLKGVSDAVRTVSDREELARLVQRSMPIHAVLLAILREVPPSARVAACGERLGEDGLLDVARQLPDATLLAAVRRRRGEPSVSEAMGLATPAERVGILMSADREEALVWALQHADMLSTTEVAQLGWEIEDIGWRLAGGAQGISLFLSLSARAGHTRTRELLARLPDLAERLLRERPDAAIATGASEVVAPERALLLLEPERTPSEIFPRLIPPLLHLLLSDSRSAHASAWLRDSRCSKAMSALSAWQVREIVGFDTLRSGLPLLLANAGDAMVEAVPLLVICLREADRQAVEAAEAGLLAMPSWPLMVSSEVLGAVRRTRATQGAPLVSRAFLPVYRDASRPDSELRNSSWWSDFWWDRAKGWRHWLADTWVSQRWPAELLSNLLEQDEELSRKVGSRLADTAEGRALWRRVRDAVGGA